ncbi:hypothetical protein KJB29_14075 [Geobacter grbiciae]|nr:hypothetical protein [Geobacter grbiciae]
MNRLVSIFLVVFVIALVSFGTWQLFLGNFEAAFSSAPFLLIVYLFLRPWRK